MEPDILGTQYTSLVYMLVSIQSYVSHAARFWLGSRVQPTLSDWSPKIAAINIRPFYCTYFADNIREKKMLEIVLE